MKRVSLLENWVQTIVKHACWLLGVGEFRSQAFIFVEHWGENNQVHSVLQNLSQDTSSVDLGVFVFLLNCSIKCALIYPCEVFNILDALFKVCHLFDVDWEESIEWYLSVDVRLTLHKAACVLISTSKAFLDKILLFFEGLGLLLGQVLRQSLVGNFDGQLANYTVCSLAVACSIKENYPVEDSFLILAWVASLSFVVVSDEVGQVFHWELSIANYELSVVLVERQWKIE